MGAGWAFIMMFVGELADFRKRVRAEEHASRGELRLSGTSPLKQKVYDKDFTDDYLAIGAKRSRIGSPSESRYFRRAGTLPGLTGKQLALSPFTEHSPPTPKRGGHGVREELCHVCDRMQTRLTTQKLKLL